MKKTSKILGMALIAITILSFTNLKSTGNYISVNNVDEFTIPENIQAIFEKSCIGCHETKAKGKKAKMKFNIDKLTNGKYSQKKLASKLRKIAKVIVESNEKKVMPPKKAVAKYPQIKLSDEEIKTLKDWATAQNKAIKEQLN